MISCQCTCRSNQAHLQSAAPGLSLDDGYPGARMAALAKIGGHPQCCRPVISCCDKQVSPSGSSSMAYPQLQPMKELAIAISA